MQSRIEELKKLCYYDIQEGKNAFESYTVTRFDTDKFAELIIKECAARSAELGQPELGKGLMKHFGVAE